ncbi:P1 family peptidase [Mycobacterium sp. AMU20-3851]|uniref:P1 family peptidase n=1 Tax=Mycobacterium sp. AMU20-3851 TaxID=3122055 RepID=UPI00375464B6
MSFGSITDVAGIRVGHHHRIDDDATLGSGWACGSTVVLAPEGTVGAVDCRGGAPGSRETDLLDPANSVRHVDAVLLTGGSAYGLAAADGVMTWLEEQGRGVQMDGGVVPIVPGAVIFDLPVGGWGCRPTAEFGYTAVQAAGTDVAIGCVGAGAGARAGVLKGGLGTASIRLADLGVTVGAVVAVNSGGNVVDPATGLPWMADLIRQFGLTAPPADQIAEFARLDKESGPLNTTIAVVATDAAVSPAGCRRIAVAAQDGLAHSIRPAHTPVDGDTVFALATGAVTLPTSEKTPAAMSPETAALTAIGAAAADCLARAVLVGVLAAQSVAGIPTYRGLLPGAFA